MRESVGEAIRRALYDGRFRAGQPLSEAGLAAEMGISRGPVREALLILVQEGLVVHSPNRGFSVVQFTESDLMEIHEVRLPLEATALVMAKPHITGEDLARLEELKAEMVHFFGDKKLIRCSELDLQFHSLIWNRTGNSRLAGTLRNLLAPFFAYGSIFSIGRPDLSQRLLAEQHDVFLQFLVGRVTLTAEDCVRFHLGL